MKTDMPYAQALGIAMNFVTAIRPYVERVEIAGSLRRRKPIIGDIEIVAIPKTIEKFDMFGEVAGRESLLDPVLKCNYHQLMGGEKYRKYELMAGPRVIDLDLFLTDPERWGVIYTIRTGSEDFSKYLVTTKQKGGALPSYMKVHDGRLWSRNKEEATPEEADFFKTIGHPYIEPEERTEGRWSR